MRISGANPRGVRIIRNYSAMEIFSNRELDKAMIDLKKVKKRLVTCQFTVYCFVYD